MKQDRNVKAEKKYTMFHKLKNWARQLKMQPYVLYLAYRDERVPWYAKVFILCVVAYAFSPIDLIPDFIPILGYFDDIILVPLGIHLALKMIPEAVVEDCRRKVQENESVRKPKNWAAAGVILLIWLLLLIWIWRCIIPLIY
ncbi:YkvA family protein [Aneurinibacillus migulanus]|uniref:YkvA family protein n=1 Tax=Aneurinibacillus migulanus TaxID=47500 RepID=UPI000A6CAAEC|nr:YkvA family protein [Aneurinibacillus migulanus]